MLIINEKGKTVQLPEELTKISEQELCKTPKWFAFTSKYENFGYYFKTIHFKKLIFPKEITLFHVKKLFDGEENWLCTTDGAFRRDL